MTKDQNSLVFGHSSFVDFLLKKPSLQRKICATGTARLSRGSTLFPGSQLFTEPGSFLSTAPACQSDHHCGYEIAG